MRFTLKGMMPLRFKNSLTFLWEALAIYLNSTRQMPARILIASQAFEWEVRSLRKKNFSL